jgi:tetratricopeptide (TPR) repeat protein
VRVAAVVGMTAVLSGCVYLNLLFNARRLFDEAERDRWDGREVEARALYDSVVAKAARSYRAEPDGEWADDALYLLGRAYLRRGEPAEAAGALGRALEITDDPDIRAGALLHLGETAISTGDRARGLTLLNDALRVLEPGHLRAEGHFWRGRILLETDEAEAGWWDLDRAAELDSRYRVAAGLERLRWGVANGDSVRAREGVSRLLALPEARVREDSLLAVVGKAADLWGAGTGARLLQGAQRAAWPQDARDRLTLARARLRLEAGMVAEAEADALAVADAVRPEATEARLFLARLRAAGAREIEDLESVRVVLLPSVADARVIDVLESIRMVEILADGSPGERPPETLFAAAELARDELDAPMLAQRLLLTYAQLGTGWRGKALLAAAQLAEDPAQRSTILEVLAGIPGDPYVRASRGGGSIPVELAELELQLKETIDRVLAEAESRARGLDVLARERAGVGVDP